MAHKTRFVTRVGMQFADKRLLLRCGVGPPQQSLVFPWDSMSNYKGKQPRAPREATPSVFGSPHARSRLRSPGLRIAHSAPSPERAQQMADQINADWQTGSIGDQNECGTTSHRVVGRASCSVQRVGNRHIGPWRLLRPFRAVGNVFVGNPGRRERSQDSRSLALGCHVAAPSGRSAVARRFAV